MTKAHFFSLLDELMEMDAGFVKPGMRLADIPKWDSLALMGFIALLDEQFQLSVPAAKINQCQTVDDLAALAGDKISA